MAIAWSDQILNATSTGVNQWYQTTSNTQVYNYPYLVYRGPQPKAPKAETVFNWLDKRVNEICELGVI